MRLSLNAVMHLLVDGVCAAALFYHCGATPMFAELVLLYNTMAFSTQCLVGLLTDRVKSYRRLGAASAVLVALGFLLPLPPTLRVLCVGLGNSIFHVSGGSETLLCSGGKAWPLGIFVAPGAIGLALGKIFPQIGFYLAGVLLLCAVISLFLRERRMVSVPAHSDVPNAIAPAAVLLLAVAVRAFGGTAAHFSWNTGLLPILMAVLVCAGKMAGGFAMDRFGAVKTAAMSILPAAILITFCANHAALSLLGQFLLNLTMPVTLLLLYRMMPRSPGFAFGLAASALWPGTLAGQLFPLQGVAAKICMLLCFLAGLAAIVYAVYSSKDRAAEGGRK